MGSMKGMMLTRTSARAFSRSFGTTATRLHSTSLGASLDCAMHPAAGAVCMTDPLHIYQSYVRQGVLKPDVQQLRAAVEFQKLCFRLRGYEPDDTTLRIHQIVRELEDKYNKRQRQRREQSFLRRQQRHMNQAEESLGGEDQPVLQHWWTVVGDYFGRYQLRRDEAQRRELIKVMSDEELLEKFPAPQGLLVNGEVGTGKSMLLDIFSDSLPIERKQRVHYHEFILWVMREIDLITKRRMSQKVRADWANQENHPMLNMENEFILYEIASRLVAKSYVLMLDEFMLPDIAAAKIVKVLFTYFFKLGGILVATSNRLPDELYSTDFNRTQFEGFSKILKLRCEVFDMGSKSDYRAQDLDNEDPMVIVSNPSQWKDLVYRMIDLGNASPDEFVNFGRTLHVPVHSNGTIKLDFNDLCTGQNYGSGDFIALAKRYHTVLIDNVPALTLQMKDQARRFITLIDALYEARCRVAMHLEMPVDELFFHVQPAPGKGRFKCTPLEDNRIDVQNAEMMTKTELDLQNPYRPNFASYEEGERQFSTNKLEVQVGGTKAFTGEDEMFAYKRAVSRIKEMGYSSKWRQRRTNTRIDQNLPDLLLD